MIDWELKFSQWWGWAVTLCRLIGRYQEKYDGLYLWVNMASHPRRGNHQCDYFLTVLQLNIFASTWVDAEGCGIMWTYKLAVTHLCREASRRPVRNPPRNISRRPGDNQYPARTSGPSRGRSPTVRAPGTDPRAPLSKRNAMWKRIPAAELSLLGRSLQGTRGRGCESPLVGRVPSEWVPWMHPAHSSVWPSDPLEPHRDISLAMDDNRTNEMC